MDIREALGDEGRVDLFMSVFCNKIFSQSFMERCRKILNLHNGPLPRYRGVSPVTWTLKNEEVEHGATIHEITAGIDEGPIISQVKYSIYHAFAEVIDVYNRGLEYAWTLFLQTMPLLGKIKARPQDNSLAAYHSKKEDHMLGERRYFTKQESLGRVQK